MEYAGFWIRVGANLIDGVILSVVGFVMSSVLGDDVGQFVTTIGGIVYYVYFESSKQQATYGKKALGLIVVNDRGTRISVGQALGRYFAKILSALILFIGFIMVGITEKKQGLHDKLADTYVISVKSDVAITNVNQ